jgi:hypothetical protein
VTARPSPSRPQNTQHEQAARCGGRSVAGADASPTEDVSRPGRARTLGQLIRGRPQNQRRLPGLPIAAEAGIIDRPDLR